MKITWNSYEPPVPIDIADNSDDYIVEIYNAQGGQLTVKSTQINSVGEVWLKINGRLGGSTLKPEALIIDRYAIRVCTFENDNIPPHEAAILSHKLKGKTLRLKVDVSL